MAHSFWQPLLLGLALAAAGPPVAGAADDPQPLLSRARRVIEAADYLGSPFAGADRSALDAALRQPDPGAASEAVQGILDRYCLCEVEINAEERIAVRRGAASPVLVEQGWRQFLIKVRNAAGSTAQLSVTSPNAISVYSGAQRGSAETESDRQVKAAGLVPAPPYDRWLDCRMFDQQPLLRDLTGAAVEYRIIQLYSRDAGRREASLAFSVGQGSQDAGFSNSADILFDCLPARPVKLKIRDENGHPCVGSLLIRDSAGRVYPAQAKRLAPDFAFQPQIYRADGDTLRLPDGAYSVRFQRGPESLPQEASLRVGAQSNEWSFQVMRWIDPAAAGWWSGDHHIHAAGCAHYTDPTQGVLPSDMERQCLGEDLKVGAVLTFGPCFDYQKQFFAAGKDAVAAYPYLLHYDIEVSGFGSQRSGHLCLLGLTDQMYPGCTSSDGWPTLGYTVLQWAKRQGAITGTAHSGWGLQPAVESDRTVAVSTSSRLIQVETGDLPNYVLPPYNGIGANEYVVDVTQQVPGPDGNPVPALDFYAAVDTPAVWELNMWYHSLNCGFRTRLAGETDFPCIYMDRVGMGRTYVKLDGPLNYAKWCEGLRNGRSYVGDGKSHLMDFCAGEARVGEKGSELRLAHAGLVKLSTRVAAYLPEMPNPALGRSSPNQAPYWDLERARVGGTREVTLEVVVNGESVARRAVRADGVIRPVELEVSVTRSSWVALRILGSSHTNPIFILVGGRPIRASRKSAEWCLRGVDQCWSQKQRFIAPAEIPAALAVYAKARDVYRRLLPECDVE
jgi:hypothetical protein